MRFTTFTQMPSLRVPLLTPEKPLSPRMGRAKGENQTIGGLLNAKIRRNYKKLYKKIGEKIKRRIYNGEERQWGGKTTRYLLNWKNRDGHEKRERKR